MLQRLKQIVKVQSCDSIHYVIDTLSLNDLERIIKLLNELNQNGRIHKIVKIIDGINALEIEASYSVAILRKQ